MSVKQELTHQPMITRHGRRQPMTTQTLDDTIVIEWPLTCIYCGSERVYYSEYKNDVRCQVCGKWQLTEEDEE